MNVQRNLIWELMLYELKKGHYGYRNNQNNCETKDAVGYSTVIRCFAWVAETSTIRHWHFFLKTMQKNRASCTLGNIMLSRHLTSLFLFIYTSQRQRWTQGQLPEFDSTPFLTKDQHGLKAGRLVLYCRNLYFSAVLEAVDRFCIHRLLT